MLFSFFKTDPTKKLRKNHERKLEEALNAQRNGNIRAYSMLTLEAEKLWAEIDRLENETKTTRAR